MEHATEVRPLEERVKNIYEFPFFSKKRREYNKLCAVLSASSKNCCTSHTTLESSRTIPTGLHYTGHRPYRRRTNAPPRPHQSAPPGNRCHATCPVAQISRTGTTNPRPQTLRRERDGYVTRRGERRPKPPRRIYRPVLVISTDRSISTTTKQKSNNTRIFKYET